MPLVEMKIIPAIIDVRAREYIIDILPDVVSKALDTPEDQGGELTPDDIEVQVVELSGQGVNIKPLSFIIHSNFFPARARNLDERRKEIMDDIKDRLPPGIKGYVWVFLNHASFQSFGPEEEPEKK